jgi:cationic peptide transport system permease protein
VSRSSLYDEEFFPSPLEQTWIEFKRSHWAFAGFWILIFFVFVVVIGPFLAPFSPLEQNPENLLLPPAWAASGDISYMFGTDSTGRDILSRVIYGARLTFGISFILVILSVVFGVLIGAYAGLSQGLRSSIVNHLLDSVMAIPTLLIAIIIVGILGTGLVNSMWAIALAILPQVIHTCRDFVRHESQMAYVTAARLDGAGNARIFVKSIFPNMIEVLVVQSTFALSTAILDISALGFLSLAAQAPSPELGAMLSDGLDIVYISPWSIALPGITILLAIISINLVGDGLRNALQRRLQH